MDYKLFLRILLVTIIQMFVFAAIVSYFSIGDFKPLYWFVLAIGLSIIPYLIHADSATKVGVHPGHENYLKTKFKEEIISDKPADIIIAEIKNQKEYLGKVTFGQDVIKRQSFKSLPLLSKSHIEIKSQNNQTMFSLQTNPVLPFIQIDSYSNLKCHKQLKEIISTR